MSSNKPDEKTTSHGGKYSSRFSDQLIEDTLATYQARTDRKLTHEDARQILENLTGFFTTLRKWDRAAEKKRAAQDQSQATPSADPPEAFATESERSRQTTESRPQTPAEDLLRESRDER